MTCPTPLLLPSPCSLHPTGPSLFCKWAPTLGLPRQRATWLTHSSHTVHVLKSHLLTEADSEPSFKWQIRYSNIKTVPIHQASSPSPCFTFTWHLAYNLTICDSLSTSTEHKHRSELQLRTCGAKPPSREETVERAWGVRRPGAGGREAQGGEAFATSPKSTDGLQRRWEPLKGPSCGRVGTTIPGARSRHSPVTSLTV